MIEIPSFLSKYIDFNKGEGPKDLLKALVLVITIIFVGVVLYFASNDVNVMTSKTYFYVMVLLIPIGISFLVVLRQMSVLNNLFNFKFALYASAAIIISAILFSVYLQADRTTSLMMESMAYVLTGLIVIVALAILWKATGNYFKRLGGFSSFVSKLIFFIPCLFTDALQAITNDYQNTPRTVTYLLWIEVFLIICYITFSYYRNNGIMDGTILLRDPIFLDLGRETILADSDKLSNLNGKVKTSFTREFNKDLTVTSSNIPNQTYSISFWVMVNHLEKMPETKIISLENYDIFHPRLTYGYDESYSQNVYKLYVNSISTSEAYILPIQKWHQFVVVYENDRIDVYLNGKMNKTFSNIFNLKGHTSTLKVGDKNQMINGAISNVVYYTKSLHESDVVRLYNLKSFQIDTGISPTTA